MPRPQQASDPRSRSVLLGVIGRPHGVRGLVRVVSYTADPADLTVYGPLHSEEGRRFVLRWRGEGIAAVAALEGGEERAITDRPQAARLTNTRLYLERDRLPPAPQDEFYFADLVGLEAFDEHGAELGRVVAVHDYGGGASLEIGRAQGTSLMVPFTREAVQQIDVPAGRLTVQPPVEREFGEVTAA